MMIDGAKLSAAIRAKKMKMKMADGGEIPSSEGVDLYDVNQQIHTGEDMDMEGYQPVDARVVGTEQPDMNEHMDTEKMSMMKRKSRLAQMLDGWDL